MMLFQRGSTEEDLSSRDLREGLFAALCKLGKRRRVIAVPPDFTRLHSRAGELTRYIWEYYQEHLSDILPALGTHSPMTAAQIEAMFGAVPHGLFRLHDWREGVQTLGRVPAAVVKELSGGAVDYDWPAQIASLLAAGGHDLILSVGQVVPHEVIGMANHNKNLLVGTGGPEGINKSHFLGAAYGMERIMGRADTPVRRLLNHAMDQFGRHLPVVYVHTVAGMDAEGKVRMRGLFISDDDSGFRRAADLALKVNFTLVAEPLRKVVVYLDPHEFKSTWLGNKSIYRTRMAIADGGELIVLAPGVKEFGEDPAIDALIRRYGYIGTPRVLDLVRTSGDLRENLSAAAHLIHGSSEGRFTITYCPGHLSRAETVGAGFQYGDLGEMLKRYDPAVLRQGANRLSGGESVYYISNPALGLWAHEGRFMKSG